MEMPFGSWLKVRRRQFDLTQAELAKLAICSLVTIRKIEQNSRRPSKQLAEAMAKALHLPADQIAIFVTYARTAPEPANVPAPLQTTIPSLVQKTAIPRQESAPVSVTLARSSAAQYPLPRPITPFFGRIEELATLRAYLLDPNVQLVSILGPGGMGKTRLALAVAEDLKNDGGQPFGDGIVFVSLAPLTEVSQIESALVDALSILIEPGRDTKQQILNFLAEKEMLLIFDNCEHLLGGVDLFQDILQAALSVCILATSRERLLLQGEQAYPIEGLGTLEQFEENAEEAIDHPAIQLFRRCAQRAEPTFSLPTDELPTAIRICQLVGEMPLAIEIAAGWVSMMSLAAILADIQGNLDFLESDLRHLPERQRSMRAVFGASWQHLDHDEQSIFKQISIFRGGFSREAASEVVGANLRQLGHLIYKSLLHYDRAQDRYELHELLRQFSVEKLAADVALESTTRARHMTFYLETLSQQRKALRGEKQEDAFAQIDADIENMRLAWQNAVSCTNITLLYGAMDSLGFYYQWRVRPDAGLEAFRLVVESLDANQSVDESADSRLLMIRALAWQASFQRQLKDPDRANELLERAMTLCDQTDTALLAVDEKSLKNERAFVYYQWGFCLERRQNELALDYFRKSIELWDALGDDWWTALGLSGLGFNLSWSNRFIEAREQLQKSIELFEKYGNNRELVILHERMSDSCGFKGDFDAAIMHSQRALALAREMGDRKALADALFRSSVVELTGLGNLETAKALNNEALVMYRSLNVQMGTAVALARRGMFALAIGDVEEAKHDFFAAREIMHAQRIRQGEGFILRWLALAEQLNGGHEDALAMISQSIDIFEEVGAYGYTPHLRVIRLLIDKANQPPLESLHWLGDVLDNALKIREYYDILWALPAIAYCLLRQESAANPETLLAVERRAELTNTENAIPKSVSIAAEINGFICSNFEYGQSAYMRALIHDENGAMLCAWPSAEIAIAQSKGKEKHVWDFAKEVLAFIQA